MKNFISIALLLIVRVTERSQSFPVPSLTPHIPDDQPSSLPPTLVAEPAHQ